MAPHRGFKYDVMTLLTGIRDRPVLWDRTLEIYKDKIERKNAWDEICNMLEEKYEGMSWEERRAVSEYIIRKWTNIRDTFVKSLKNKMGNPKKKYMLYNHLKFLTKVVPEEEINEEYYSTEEQSSMSQGLENQEEGTLINNCTTVLLPPTSSRKKKRADYNEECILRKTKRERKTPDSSQDSEYEPYDAGSLDCGLDFVEVDTKVESDPRVMNEDEAFFASLLPTVVRYDEDERLEFRIQVLAAMKKIKDKKRGHSDD